jgi:hypothetical protein
MREFGIILLVLLTITFLVTIYLLIKDSIWLKRLNKYRTSESLKPIKVYNLSALVRDDFSYHSNLNIQPKD